MTAALDVMLMIAVAMLDTVRGDTVGDYGAQEVQPVASVHIQLQRCLPDSKHKLSAALHCSADSASVLRCRYGTRQDAPANRANHDRSSDGDGVREQSVNLPAEEGSTTFGKHARQRPHSRKGR